MLPHRRPLRFCEVPQRHSVCLTETRTSVDPAILAPSRLFDEGGPERSYFDRRTRTAVRSSGVNGAPW